VQAHPLRIDRARGTARRLVLEHIPLPEGGQQADDAVAEHSDQDD